MTGLLKQRARIVRVRRIRHGLAAGAAAEAAGRVEQLETSSRRLAELRSELQADTGVSSGAGLARLGELAMRLDAAHTGLGRSIDAARLAVEHRERVRLARRIEQESAEKLQQRAAGAAAELAERQSLRPPRPRARRLSDGGDQ